MTRVYVDNHLIREKELPFAIKKISNERSVITDPTNKEKEIAYIEYGVVTGRISKLYVEAKWRNKHLARSLIYHVLSQLDDDQLISVSPKAVLNEYGYPDDEFIPGLPQAQLKKYYKRFTYGRHRRHILFPDEMPPL